MLWEVQAAAPGDQHTPKGTQVNDDWLPSRFGNGVKSGHTTTLAAGLRSHAETD